LKGCGPGDPATIDAITRLGDEFENQGAAGEAVGFYRQGLEWLRGQPPHAPQSMAQVSYWMIATQDYSSAADLLGTLEEQVAKADPSWARCSLSYRRALALLMSGRLPEYHEVCAQLVNAFEQTNDPRVANALARLFLAVPEARHGAQANALRNWMALIRATRPAADEPGKAWSDLALGLERFRDSDWNGAVEHLRAAGSGSEICSAVAQLLLSRIDDARGKKELSRRLLLEAEARVNAITRSRYTWWDEYLLFQILLRESRPAATGAG
jgi:hypothetical protein